MAVELSWHWDVFPLAELEPVADGPQASVYFVESARSEELGGELARTVVTRGFALRELVEEKPDLEQAFLSLTSQAAMAA